MAKVHGDDILRFSVFTDSVFIKFSLHSIAIAALTQSSYIAALYLAPTFFSVFLFSVVFVSRELILVSNESYNLLL